MGDILHLVKLAGGISSSESDRCEAGRGRDGLIIAAHISPLLQRADQTVMSLHHPLLVHQERLPRQVQVDQQLHLHDYSSKT